MSGGNGRRLSETLIEYFADEDACDWPLAYKAVGYKGPGWYYWNRDWSQCHGPFSSKETCELAASETGITQSHDSF